MKAKKNWIWVAICISLLVALSVKLFAVTWNEKERLEEYGVSTLRGLEGVRPVVLFWSPNKNKLGFHDTSNWRLEFQMESELALRRNGIKVLDAGLPTLTIFIEANAIETTRKLDIYAFKVATYLEEEVQLVRDPKLLAKTPTWPHDSIIVVGRGVMMAGRNKVKPAIREQVIQQMNEFCNDYLAANPKEQPPQQKTEK